MKKRYCLIKLIAISLGYLFSLSCCTSSKPTPVNMKQLTNVSCDANTKVCTSSESAENFEMVPVTKKDVVELNYYYDALCGWCYGFSPVVEQLQQRYKDQLKINVISGGLFTGNNVGKVNNIAPHIKSGAYKSVEMMTSVKFGKKFLKDVFSEGNMVLNSTPPTKALSIIRDYFPEKELAFAADLLKAVYYDGIFPEDVEAYIPYVVNIGMDAGLFLKEMHSEVYEQKIEKEIKKFRQSQHSGMPAITVLDNGVEIPIAKGYVSFAVLENRLSNFLK